MYTMPTLFVLAVSVLSFLALVVRRLVVIGRPDEWVVRIRSGRLIHAGVGIFLVRRPWDRVARFTAAMQRVSFAADALSRENLPVSVQGFILWSVSAQGDGPFLAFSKLGIQDSGESTDPAVRERKHLLSRPQHRAFQQLLTAAVERHAARFNLLELLTQQDAFLQQLAIELRQLTEPMGVQLDGLQILQVRPAEPAIFRQLSASFVEETREKAARAHLETEERIKRLEIESASQVAQEKVRAAFSQEIVNARAALEAQQEKAALLEAQLEARQRELEHEQRLALLRSEQEHARKQAEEHHQTVLQDLVLAREEAAFAVKLERRRRLAEAQQGVIQAITQAEEAKPQAVRDHELARLQTIKLAEAFTKLPLSQAQWVTVGDQTPAQGLASLLAAGRTLLATPH